MTDPNCIEIVVNHFRQLNLSVQEASERLHMDEQDIAIMYTELQEQADAIEDWKDATFIY